MNNNSKVEELVSKLGESVVTAINDAHRKVLVEAVSAERKPTKLEVLTYLFEWCGFEITHARHNSYAKRGTRSFNLGVIAEHDDMAACVVSAFSPTAEATDSHKLHRLAGQIAELQDIVEKGQEAHKLCKKQVNALTAQLDAARTALLEYNVQVERLCRLIHLPAVVTPLKVVVDKVEDNIKQYGEALRERDLWKVEAERWRSIKVTEAPTDIPYEELGGQATAGLTFEEAFRAMRHGAKIRRASWSAPIYASMKHNSIFTAESMLATDWEIIP